MNLVHRRKKEVKDDFQEDWRCIVETGESVGKIYIYKEKSLI